MAQIFCKSSRLVSSAHASEYNGNFVDTGSSTSVFHLAELVVGEGRANTKLTCLFASHALSKDRLDFPFVMVFLSGLSETDLNRWSVVSTSAERTEECLASHP